jgi:glycosyltransferase involved in cell wall biosynthesis
MTVPFVTVLITTYNYGQFVEQAIDSVLAQDFPPDKMQILVVDDGSTDGTSERVKKYGSRIDYFYKPNGGQASALNFGFARARGEIIALLDADDYFLPIKLARVADAFRRDPTLGLVYHRLEEWHMKTGERHESRSSFTPVSGDIRKTPGFFLQYVPQATSCISYRRAALEAFLPIPERIRMLADGYLTILIPFRSAVFAIPEFLAVYRVHGKNSYYADDREMPAGIRRTRLQQWRILMDAMRQWLADNGHTRKQQPVRDFLDRWALYIEDQEFQVAPPGRRRFFSHLIAYNRCYGPQIAPRLRIINYINALGALVVGYKHFPLLKRWPEKVGRALRR